MTFHSISRDAYTLHSVHSVLTAKNASRYTHIKQQLLAPISTVTQWTKTPRYTMYMPKPHWYKSSQAILLASKWSLYFPGYGPRAVWLGESWTFSPAALGAFRDPSLADILHCTMYTWCVCVWVGSPPLYTGCKSRPAAAEDTTLALSRSSSRAVVRLA